MKLKSTGLILALFLFTMPFSAFGAEHGMKDMDHGSMQSMDHTGMEMSGDMIMLEGDMQEGVKGMAHLRDVREAMSKMGMEQTHHFMVMFTDAESGRSMDKGTVAVKVVDPAGNKSKAHKLMYMEGSFGVDVILKDKGMYMFEVGTKLNDGKKRQFSFHHTVE